MCMVCIIKYLKKAYRVFIMLWPYAQLSLGVGFECSGVSLGPSERVVILPWLSE